MIKQEVNRVVDLISYEKAQSEILTKEKIQSRIYEAYSIAQNIYQLNRTAKTETEIQQMILDAIQPIRFEQGNGYYFISRLDGKAILFPGKPELEGKNLLEVQDIHGKYITKDIIKIVEQSGEGFYQYHWTKPHAEGNNFKKISFIKRLGLYDWFIGTGLYVVDVENEIESDLLSTISRIRFGKEGYIFINRLNGDALVSNGKLILGRKKLWEGSNKNPEKIKDIFEKEYNAALKPDGDYIYYSWEKLTNLNKESPKTSFIYGIPDLQWIVGAGVYLDDVETDIALMRTQLNNQIKANILYSILIVIGVSAIFFLFFNWLNLRLKNDFKLFFSFFSRAPYSDEKIDRKTVRFVELDRMAGYANKMLTGRKQAEEALQKSEKRYRFMAENVADIIWTLDMNFNFTYISPSVYHQRGYTVKEAMEQLLNEMLPPDSLEKAMSLFGEKIELIKVNDPEGWEPVIFEIEQFCKDGTIIPTSNNARILQGPDKQPQGILGVTRNITREKLAEKEKINAQKIVTEQKRLALVGQIAGKMAHDFNNILGIIMGNAELSLLDCKDTETRKILELIFEQTIRGKNLTKNLVAFAKDQEPKQEFFRISEKIDLVVNLMRKDLNGIELLREESPGVPELLADPGMIEHSLVNLIQNSIHATSLVEYPRIIVRTHSLDNEICFEIEDNGCGIPKKYLEAIYEPSFTLKGSKDIAGSYKAGIKGTGYGMSNVKKYIELHKGNISVNSEIGSGSKFTISLPVIKKELTNEEKIELREELTHFEKYILLVEDETAISNVQYRVLTNEPCNHKVDIANTGQIAMDLFDRTEYDFISLDYVLPGGINGMDVYHHIRKTDKSIPILFVSGNIEFLESIKELKQKDINIDHISKPCMNKVYVNSINKLLEHIQ